MLIIFIMLYITFLVLTYLKTGSLYLLTTFIQFPLLPSPASGNHKSDLFFIIFLKFILFIYFWLHWVFVAARGLSLVAASGGYSSLQCVGFSLWWLLLLRSSGFRPVGFSSCGSWALEHRLSSCGAQT